MFYSEEEIIVTWAERIKKIKKNEVFSLYVDNPFCVNQCLYCKHTGADYKKNFKDCRLYYEKLLPHQITAFSPLLKTKTADTIYFGGGTSSIMTSEDMKNIFDVIGNFKNIENKVFECSPNLLSKEKANLLIQNNFTYVSFGIQSFKKEVLDFNGRMSYDNIPLKEYIKAFEDAGVAVNCDLMIFIGEDKGQLSEIKRLEEDLIKLLEEYQPSFITIYPETLFLKENRKRGVFLSKELRKMILSIADKYNLNHWNWHLSLEEEDIEREMEVCYHLTIKSEESIMKAKKYDSTGPPNQREEQNVLSFGGYKNHRPYSYHGRDFLYYNINDNNDKFYYYGEKRDKPTEPLFFAIE